MVVVGDGDDGTSFLLREGEGMVLVVGLEEEELVLMVAVVVLLLVRTVVRLGVGTAHNAESPSRRIAPLAASIVSILKKRICIRTSVPASLKFRRSVPAPA